MSQPPKVREQRATYRYCPDRHNSNLKYAFFLRRCNCFDHEPVRDEERRNDCRHDRQASDRRLGSANTEGFGGILATEAEVVHEESAHRYEVFRPQATGIGGFL